MPEPARQARVPAAPAVDELRDRDLGKPQEVVQLVVGEQSAVRGEPGAAEFDLDPAIESGSRRGLFGFTLRRVPRSRPIGRANPLTALPKSGNNVTRH